MGQLVIRNDYLDTAQRVLSSSQLVDLGIRPIIAQHVVNDGRLDAVLEAIEHAINEFIPFEVEGDHSDADHGHETQ